MNSLFLWLDSHQQPSVKYTSVASVQAAAAFLFICTALQVGAEVLPVDPAEPRKHWASVKVAILPFSRPLF